MSIFQLPSPTSTPTAYSEASWIGWINTTGDALLILEAARRGLIPRVTRPLTDSGRRMINSGSVFVFDEDESGIKQWADGLRWSPGRLFGNFLWYREIEQEDRRRGAAWSKSPESVWLGPSGTDTSSNPNKVRSKSGGLIKKIFSLNLDGVIQRLISYYRIEDVEIGRLCSPSSLPEISSLDISPEFLNKAHFFTPPKIEIGPDGVPRYRGEAVEVEVTAPPVLALPPLPSVLASHTIEGPTSSHSVGRKHREGRGNDGTHVRPTASTAPYPTAHVSPGRRMRLDFIAPRHSQGLSRTMLWSNPNPLSSADSNDQVFLLLKQIICHDRRPGLPGEGLLWIRNHLATHEGPVLQKLADLIQSVAYSLSIMLYSDYQTYSILSQQLDLPFHLHAFRLRLRLSRRVFDRRCLRILRHLSSVHHILPMSLTVVDIRQRDRHPVAGGGFSDIWRGTLGEKLVCLKVLRIVSEPDENVRENIRMRFYSEALIWRQLKHPNILPLLGVNVELFTPSFCLISPWLANKDVISFLKQNPLHNRLSVFLDIASGLSYLHTKITHGDIRGANILVTDDLHCCLADFGLALTTSDSQAWSVATTGTMKGAIRWMAPELIDTNGIPDQVLKSPSRDIFALGCTILEILTLQLPFHDQKTDYAVLACLIAGKRPARPKHVWCPDAIWNIIIRCWVQDPGDRPRAQEVYDALKLEMIFPPIGSLPLSSAAHARSEAAPSRPTRDVVDLTIDDDSDSDEDVIDLTIVSDDEDPLPSRSSEKRKASDDVSPTESNGKKARPNEDATSARDSSYFSVANTLQLPSLNSPDPIDLSWLRSHPKVDTRDSAQLPAPSLVNRYWSSTTSG
ncbi:hypothetical protein D9757_013866 [Collybiopsis confluens]|uniref:Protein kinase domain-containing protein n=1 Tax=Collybiopsis confluens TaxID=2823264 RepID=A0A8H5CQ92_9AGAR|nr:hypothetical protein D9757_013866 [Collybiopsis confluens]